MSYQKSNTVPCVEQLEGPVHRVQSCRNSEIPLYIAVVRETGPTAPKSNECPLVHRFIKRPGVVLEA